MTKQEDIESEISKKLNTIDGIKDSNITRQVCLDSISSANEEILIFFPTANSFLRYEKIGAIERLIDVVKQRKKSQSKDIGAPSCTNREGCRTEFIFARYNSQNENL